jgi:DnaJ-class molecular chaperone
MSLPDYYKILQVDPGADPEVVTAAFRALARKLHPDRDISGVEEYRMAELNRAYGVLRDPAMRQQYNRERALRMEAMGPGEDATPPQARSGGLAARWNRKGAPSNGSAEAEPGETVLSFGRYAGQTLSQIAAHDADYLRWLGRHSSGLRYRRQIEQILRESLEAGFSSRNAR